MGEKLMPDHIAIIMDGNRRWAKKNNMPVKLGHKQGAETLKAVVRHANKIGLKYITVYAFSTENWKRSEDEVNGLMKLLENYLNEFTQEADTENLVIKVIGDLSALSENLQKSIDSAIKRTEKNTGTIFTIALNYGGRDELVHCVRNIAEEVKNGKLDINSIDENTITNHLYTKNMPDPDLIIRTSGELRLSGFLTWQSVYSEFMFFDKLWPDFTGDDLDAAIAEFNRRTRKFGAN